MILIGTQTPPQLFLEHTNGSQREYRSHRSPFDSLLWAITELHNAVVCRWKAKMWHVTNCEVLLLLLFNFQQYTFVGFTNSDSSWNLSSLIKFSCSGHKTVSKPKLVKFFCQKKKPMPGRPSTKFTLTMFSISTVTMDTINAALLSENCPLGVSCTEYSLVQWNWFSDVTACTWLTCNKWRQRAIFTAPGCTW